MTTEHRQLRRRPANRWPTLSVCITSLASLLFCTGLLADGRSDYLLYCGGCHLANGSGDPPEVPDLRVNLDLFAGFPDGRAYLTQVPGAAQVPISDDRLATVINWILSNYYPGQHIAPYSAAEVAEHRSTVLMDPLRRRRELMGQLTAAGDTAGAVSDTPMGANASSTPPDQTP